MTPEKNVEKIVEACKAALDRCETAKAKFAARWSGDDELMEQLREALPLALQLQQALPKAREALEPMILDVIANEIENSADSFKHSARIHTLRLLAKQQRAALQSLDGKEE